MGPSRLDAEAASRNIVRGTLGPSKLAMEERSGLRCLSRGLPPQTRPFDKPTAQPMFPSHYVTFSGY